MYGEDETFQVDDQVGKECGGYIIRFLENRYRKVRESRTVGRQISYRNSQRLLMTRRELLGHLIRNQLLNWS